MEKATSTAARAWAGVVAVALIVGAAEMQCAQCAHTPLPRGTERGEASAPTGVELHFHIPCDAVARGVGSLRAVQIKEGDEGVASFLPTTALPDAGEGERGAAVVEGREIAVVDTVVAHAEKQGAFDTGAEGVRVGGLRVAISEGEKRKDSPPREEKCFAGHV